MEAINGFLYAHTPVKFLKMGNLTKAVKYNRLDAVENLLSTSSHEDVENAMYTAMFYEHLQILKYLLQHDSSNINALVEYAASLQNPEVLKLLLQYKPVLTTDAVWAAILAQSVTNLTLLLRANAPIGKKAKAFALSECNSDNVIIRRLARLINVASV